MQADIECTEQPPRSWRDCTSQDCGYFKFRSLQLFALLSAWTLVLVPTVQHTLSRSVHGRIDDLQSELAQIKLANMKLLKEREALEQAKAALPVQKVAPSSLQEAPAEVMPSAEAMPSAAMPLAEAMPSAEAVEPAQTFAADLEPAVFFPELHVDSDMTAEQRQLHTEAVRRQRALGFEGFDWEGPKREHVSRRLSGLMLISTTAASGCFAIDVNSVTSKALNGDNCNSNRCPSCFLLSGAAATITFSQCSSSRVTSGVAISSQVLRFDFINTDASNTIKVTDGTNTVSLGAKQSVTAYCSSALGNAFYFPSTVYCPSACDAASPVNEAGTAFSTIKSPLAATTTKLETWDTVSGSGGFCPRGCDIAVPNYGSGNAFSVTKNPLTATTNIIEDWGTNKAGGGLCPRGCDDVTPNFASGSGFTVTKGITTAVTGYLTDNPPNNDVIYNTAGTCSANQHVCMSR